MPLDTNEISKGLDLTGAMRLKRCRHGTMLYTMNDLTIGRALDRYGEFSEIEAAFMCGMIKPGDHVVEVGANMGSLTVPLANAVGPAGSLTVFEPQPILFQNLCANVALNGFLHVRTINAAIGAEPGSVRLPKLDFEKPGLFGAHGIGSNEDGDLCLVYKLDDILSLPSCKLMKIDVEGMEQDVIRGSTEFIKQHRPILYVENDRKEKSPELISVLQELGYVMYWHLPPLFNPMNFFGESVNDFGRTISINMLCAPDWMKVNDTGGYRISGPSEWWKDRVFSEEADAGSTLDITRDDPLRR